MKIIYRGDCDDLYGQEIEAADHDCAEYARFHEDDHYETHGLDCGPYEHVHEEWWQCAICRETFDEKPERRPTVAELLAEQEVDREIQGDS